MIQHHKLNLDESQKAYMSCAFKIEPKNCYHNVYRVATENRDKVKSGEWKIAYGYMKVTPDSNLYARHCFMVNIKNEVIDPTIIATCFKHDIAIIDGYFSFYIYEDFRKYVEDIFNNSGYPDLLRTLREHDVDTMWAAQNGMILLV